MYQKLHLDLTHVANSDRSAISVSKKSTKTLTKEVLSLECSGFMCSSLITIYETFYCFFHPSCNIFLRYMGLLRPSWMKDESEGTQTTSRLGKLQKCTQSCPTCNITFFIQKSHAQWGKSFSRDEYFVRMGQRMSPKKSKIFTPAI